MKASDYIVEFLKQQNISKVFGYIGGMIAHITDSIYTSDSIEMINTINEQGAGFAAEGYARSTGNVSVAIARKQILLQWRNLLQNMLPLLMILKI